MCYIPSHLCPFIQAEITLFQQFRKSKPPYLFVKVDQGMHSETLAIFQNFEPQIPNQLEIPFPNWYGMYL